MRARRIVLAFALAFALALCSPGVAGAAELAGPVVSDGKRWAAWPTQAGRVTVYDDRDQRRRDLRVPECPLTAVGAGMVVVACPSTNTAFPDAVLVDIRTGAVTNAGNPGTFGGVMEYGRYTAVGTHGLRVDVEGYHYRAVYGFNWRTGARYRLEDRRHILDLDVPKLSRPLCAPLSRTPTPEFEWDMAGPYLPMLYERPWAVEDVARPDSTTLVRLWRCGSRSPRILARCSCSDVSLGRGLVTWQDGFRVRAYEPATGRRRSWPFETERRPHVSQAGRSLVLWTSGSTDRPSNRLVKIVRWPTR